MSDRSCLCLVAKPLNAFVSSAADQKSSSRSGFFRGLLPGAALLLALGSLLRPAMAQAPAPLVTFLPGTQSTLLTGFVDPEGVAIDSSGNLYIADTAAASGSTVYKETLSGGSYTQSTIGSGFIGAWAVAVDSSGNVYVADYGNEGTGSSGSAVYKETLSGDSYTQSKIASGFIDADGVAVDSSGNVYVADFGCPEGCVPALSGGLYKETFSSSTGTYTQTTIASGPNVTGVAVDSSGNLYFAVWTDAGVSGAVYKETLSGSSYTQSIVASNLLAPESVTATPSGILYVADDHNLGTNGSGIVYQETPLTGGGYSQSELVTDLDSPEDVALGGNGNLYIADITSVTDGVNPAAGSIYKEDYADPPSLSFANTNVGSTSSAQTVTVNNIGNAALDFEIPSSGNNPSIASGFTLASGGGECPLVTSESSSVGTLASAASCSLTVAFAPQATGSYSGSTLVLTDNNANTASPYATQTIDLSGTGTGTDVASYFTVTGSSPVTAGVQSSITVKVYDALGQLVTGYTGTVHFTSSDPAAALPANSTLSSGTGTFNLTLKTAGSQTVTATDTTTSSVTGSAAITVDAGTATHLAVSAPSTATAGTSFGITVLAYDAYGNFASSYGGTVHFTSTDGSASLPANSALSNGEGNFTATLRTAGSQTVTATDTVTSPITGTSSTINVDQAPAITSASSATFTAGTLGSFTVTASGSPSPTFTETGTLPSGVTLNSNGTLSGTPAAGTGGVYPITITASNGVGTNATQNFTLTVNQAPAITSANNTAFTAGSAGSFTVTATGFPSPTITETGTLPSGVTLSSAGVLSGTPAAGTGGSYVVTITASNGVGANATQTFTLTVYQAPAIISANSTTFTANEAGTFTIATIAFPVATLSETGALPSGVTFTSAGVLSGTPGASTAGSYPFTITAGNGISPIATQNFTLTVSPPPSYVVTTATDDASGVAANCPSGGPSGGSGLNCSLRDALAAANATGGAEVSFDSTVFAASNSAAQNTITLGSGGTLSIPPNTNIAGQTAGNGATLTNLVTVSGNNQYRVFMVNSGVTGAAIADLTIANGQASAEGGGLDNFGTLSITNTTFTHNISGQNYFGGGIDNSGTLTVTGSTFSGNTASEDGGGIANDGALTVTNSTFSGNTGNVGNQGGGIANFGTLTVTDSTFSANTAGNGGAILNNGGTLNVTDSIFAGNSAPDGGGGIYNNDSSNTANASYDVYWDNIGSSGEDDCNGCTSNSFAVSAASDPVSSPGNYGGPTQTMIPLPGSVAICAINPSAATGTDQRGLPRITTYGATTCQDSGAVQTNYALNFSTDPPASVSAGTSFGSGVTLDESGSPFVVTATPLPTITIPLALNGSGTLAGGSAAINDATGIATYSGLQVSQAGSDTLTANLTLNPNITPTALSISATSSTFDVTLAPPTVTAVTPNSGPVVGGTAVTITGTNLTGATAVDFGSSPSVSVTVVNSTTITAFSPSGTGVVDVTVTTPGGTSVTTAADQFTYAGPPTLAEAFGASPINIGTSTSLTFTITNPNTLALTGVSFSDTLPAGLTVATPSALTNSCGGTATATAGGSSIVLSGASVPANRSCTLSANVTAITSGSKINTTGVITSSQSYPGNNATATLAVSALTLSPSAGPLASGTVAVGYSQQFSAGNGALPYTYTVSAGSIPAGLTLNSATGLLTGTPTAGGPFSFSVQAEDNNSNTVTQAYTLTIAAPTIVLSPNSLPAGTYGTAYSQTITASGGTAPYNYQISAGSLPAGVSLASNGVLSGAPSATGTFPFTVEATDSSTVTGHYSGSMGFVLSIGKATLAIAANNAAKIYGTTNPTFTGTVTGQQSGNTFTESFQTGATISSPVGAYAIVPSVTGTNLADYAESVTDGTLTVTQAASSTTLTASGASITPGQSVTLSAVVTSATTGTPTGTVSFYDGTTLLGTEALSAGSTSYSTASLAAGITHSFTAAYSGDTNFIASTSTSIASVAIAPLNFTMTITGPSSATVIPGNTVTYQVAVTPDYGVYAGTVNFAVSGLPAGATATFSPASIAANGGPQTVTVTIQTAPATTAMRDTSAPPGRGVTPFALALLLLFGAGGLRKHGRAFKRLLSVVVLLAAGAAAISTLSGCGSANGFFNQTPQNYAVTITATSGMLQQSATVTVNLQ